MGLMKLAFEAGKKKRPVQGLQTLLDKMLDEFNRMEEETGREMVIRSRGGTTGGHTVLTDFGKRYLKVYDEYNQSVQAFAKKEMERLFSNLYQEDGESE